jgi:hypothetical protein
VDVEHARERRSPGGPPGHPRSGIRAAASAAARLAVYTIVVMAYDQELAGRIRQLIGSDPELTEKKMFGGLAFPFRATWLSQPVAGVVPWCASIPRSRTP